MPPRRHRDPMLALAVLALALPGLIGCSGGDGDTTGEEPVTVDQVLGEAASAMAAVESAAFTLEQTGAAVPIDEEGQLLFQAAEGRIARPSSADALITVEALGFTTEVGAIAIDGTVWFTNPLSGEWTEAPAGFTFDPATLLDPEDGFSGLLTEVVPSARLLDEGEAGDGSGDDPPSGGPWHRVEAVVPAQRVEVLTGGLIGAETTVDAWIDRDDHRLAQLRFDLPIGAETSSWSMVISDYGVEVEISPPELAGTGS